MKAYRKRFREAMTGGPIPSIVDHLDHQTVKPFIKVSEEMLKDLAPQPRRLKTISVTSSEPMHYVLIDYATGTVTIDPPSSDFTVRYKYAPHVPLALLQDTPVHMWQRHMAEAAASKKNIRQVDRDHGKRKR